MFQNLLYLTNLLLIFIVVDCSGGISPCPQVFEYKLDVYGIYGIVRLPGQIGTNHLKIKFALEEVPDESSKAVIKILDIDGEIIRKLQTGENIKYTIEFPFGIKSIPEILSIMLNNEEYCANKDGITNSTIRMAQFKVEIKGPGGGKPTVLPISQSQAEGSSEEVLFTETTQSPSATTVPKPTVLPIPQSQSEGSIHVQDRINNWFNSKFNEVCGRKVDHPWFNVYPWLVALLDNDKQFSCTGSLVSNRHVITTADCTVFVPWFFVVLGIKDGHDLSLFGRNVYQRSKSIVNHPEYNAKTGHADISIVTLTEKVTFSDTISPICLWSSNPDHNFIDGNVLGWFVRDNKFYVQSYKTNTMVSSDECKNTSDPLTFEDAFCAVEPNNCNPQEYRGSPLMVKRDNRWYIKGIPSRTELRQITPFDYVGFPCLTKYTVFSDVGKYLGWLTTNLPIE